MYSNKLLLISVVLVITGCSMFSNKDVSTNQGVVGRVMLKPDYDHSDMSYYNNPPDLTPRPIFDATVYLMENHGKNLNSRNIISKTVTDSSGYFKITAPAGKYNLAVYANVSSVISLHSVDDTIGLDFPIITYDVIVILSGEFISHEFMIFEMVPQ